MRVLSRSTVDPKTAKRLVSDLSEIASKAQDVLEQVGSGVQDTFETTKETLRTAGTAVSDTARHAADVTDEYVKANPWKTLGVAAAAGIFVGMLIMMTRR